MHRKLIPALLPGEGREPGEQAAVRAAAHERVDGLPRRPRTARVRRREKRNSTVAASRRSFPKGHRITGRKSPGGQDLGSVEVLVDERGFATGFKPSDALPLW